MLTAPAPASRRCVRAKWLKESLDIDQKTLAKYVREGHIEVVSVGTTRRSVLDSLVHGTQPMAAE